MDEEEFLETTVSDIILNCAANGDNCVGCCFHLKSGDCVFMRTGPEHWFVNLEENNGPH